MDVRDLERELLSRFPATDAEPWDHIGLSVGDPDDTVRGVAVALDATAETIRLAREGGANVLVTHHPVYIDAPSRFVPEASGASVSSAVVFEAVRTGVSVISLHTNLDRGVAARERMAALLGIERPTSLEFPAEPGRRGLGVLGEIRPQHLSEIARVAAHAFGGAPRVWGPADAEIRLIAALGGSLGHCSELVATSGAEAVVCGEAGYHTCLDLASRGIAVILLGHDRSEEPFVEILKEACREAGVPADDIYTIDARLHWWTATEGESYEHR